MSEWDDLCEEFLIYNDHELFMKLKSVGDRMQEQLQEKAQLLGIANRRMNDLAMRQTKAIQFIDHLLETKGGGWSQMALLYEVKDLLEGKK